MMKRAFVNGRMNLDIDERLLEDGDYREANNIEIINSEGSDVGAIENSLSNKKLTNIDYGANPVTICKPYEDETRDKIYWFTVSDSGTFLIEWDDINKISSIVLKDTRTEDVDRVLDIKKDFFITGIVKVISEDYKKDLLIWTDNNMEICCINIERAKTWGENNFSEEDIYLIKKQPKYAPKITPTYSSEESNYLEEIFMSFAYRYKYRDGERSALSTFSNYNFNPKKFEMDYQSMENIGMVNAFNATRVAFNTGPKQVTDIEIIAKLSNSNTLYLINSFNKEEEGWSLVYSEEKSFVFSNNKIYQILAEKELFRTFDNVPRKAKAITLSENILMIGNYVEGYDVKDSNNNPLKLEYTVDVESNDVNGVEAPYTLNVAKDIITINFPSDISLNKNTRLIFNLKLSDPDYDGSYVNTIEYVLTEDFANAIELANNLDFIFLVEEIFTSQFLVDFDIDVDSAWTLSSNTPFTITGSTTNSIQIKAILLNYTVDDTPLDTGDNPANTHTEVVPFFFDDGTSVFYSNIKSVTSCKTNRDYEVGFLYQDKWIRKSTVLTGQNNTVYIPQKFSIFQNKLLINVNHPAPFWADSYKLIVKANPLQYQVIYATVYYADGVYRWVKLEGANRDKVKEGDILIVKSDLNGPITDIIKTRVLEVTQKTKDFIEGNKDSEDNDIIEEEGLYMKIKPRGYDMSFTENAIINVDRVRSAGKNRQEKFQADSISSGFFGDTTKINNWKTTTGNNDLKKPALDILDFNNYDENGVFISAIEIIAGSKINFYLKSYENGDGVKAIFEKDFIAASTHANIKDWWEEEVGTLGSKDDDFDINFEEQSGEIRILIQANNSGGASDNNQARLAVRIDAILVEGLVIFETEPKQAEDFKFYETEETFDIVNGLHKGNVQDQTNSIHAVISLDFFNCYVQGNGVESFRVKDAVNTNFLNIDLKPTSTSIEKYKEVRRFSDITFGEGYIESTNMNGLNVFNTSQLNFKELEKQYNSIQFLFTRDRNVVVFQEDKTGYVLFGRDLLTMANGEAVLSTTPEILGEYVPYQGENGCGTTPESISWDAFRFYYANPRMGTPIRLSIDGTSEINYGMVSFFRDLFINNPTSKKIGGYDPYHKKWVLTSEDEVQSILNVFCGNTITKTISEAFEYVLNLNGLEGDVVLNYNISSGNATIQAVYDGNIYVASNVTGVGNLTFQVDDISATQVYVTITPTSEEATVQLSNTCPLGTALKITTIVLADEEDLSKTITNRFKINNGSFFSTSHYFDTVEVDSFVTETGIEGVGKFPKSGDTITIQSLKTIFDSAFFRSANGNNIRFLVSSVDYSDSDINTILSLSTEVSLAETIYGDGSILNTGSFVFNRPSVDQNLYLIFNYKDIPVVAVDDSFTIYQGSEKYINVLFNDTVIGDVNVEILIPPINGTAVVLPNNTIYYVHNGSSTTSDSITYKLSNESSSDTATISGTILADPGTGGPGGTEGVAFSTSSTGSPGTNGEAACGYGLSVIRYHNGTDSDPKINDIVYVDLAKTTVFNGQNLFYAVEGGRTIKIDTNGEIYEEWFCSPGGEL